MSETEGLTTLPTGEVVVRLEGEIDLNDRARLAGLFRRALHLSPRLIVDLTELTFIDGTGLSRLLWARERAQSRGGAVILVGARPSISRVLILTGIADLLPQYPDITSATTGLRGHSDKQVRPREQPLEQHVTR